MDVETYGDFIYYADLKHNAVERINRKAFKETGKLDRPQQYGPGEFFSIASLHIVTDEVNSSFCGDILKTCEKFLKNFCTPLIFLFLEK